MDETIVMKCAKSPRKQCARNSLEVLIRLNRTRNVSGHGRKASDLQLAVLKWNTECIVDF